MKILSRFLAACVSVSLVLAQAPPAQAGNRVNWYGQMNPISTWLNLSQRYNRLSNGAWRWNAFGSNSAFGGAFANLSVATAGSLNVTVGPTNASFPGALYGLGVDDTAQYPASQPSGATGLSLAADSTQLVLDAVVTSATNAIGTTAGGSAGQSVVNLIECKPVTSDATSQTINLINSSGGSAGTASVNRDRIDSLSCQDKTSASAPTPSIPGVDSGYTAIGYVTVPNGTSSVTSGMITNYANFQGFATANQAGAIALDTSSTAQTKIGNLTDSGSVTAQGNLVFGSGSGGTGGTFTGSNGNGAITGIMSATDGFSAGTSGVSTAGGALTYGVDTDGSTSATIASNDGSCPNGVCSSLFGIFAEPSGTNVVSVDTSGNVGLIGTEKVGQTVIAGAGGNGEYWQTENGHTMHQYIDSGSFLHWYNADSSTTVPANLNLSNGTFTAANLTTSGTVTAGSIISSGQILSSSTITGNGISTTGAEASAQFAFPANYSTNITAIGENAQNGYPYFDIAKLSSGGTFQNWLLGIDSSYNLNVPNGSVTTPNNVVVGNGSHGATMYGGSGNINHTGSLTTGGSNTTGGSITSQSGNITAQSGSLSTSTGANAGRVYFGSSGTNAMDFGITAGGQTTLPGLGTAGVVTNNGSGTLSSIAPGTAGNYLVSNGSFWQSYSTPQGLSSPGWVSLPGGVIIQWGTIGPYSSESGQTVSFPVAFPHSIFSATATLLVNGSPSVGIDQGCQVYNTTSLTQMGVYMQQYGGGTNTYPQYCNWTAIGW